MKKFIVALHVRNLHQALQEAAKILTPKGAHGVLLVNNGFKVYSNGNDFPDLFDIAFKIKELYPNYLVGINPLDFSNPLTAIKQMKTRTGDVVLDMLWTDDGGIKESEHGVYRPDDIAHALGIPSFTYYGGIAFKYKEQPKNLKLVAATAAEYFGAVVTSGNETGMPPTVEKMQVIKSAVGDKRPIAIASGMTAENVREYIPYTDIFIVGTSLLVDPKNQFMYDQQKVEDFRFALKAA